MEVLRADDAETWHRLCSDTFVPLDSETGENFVGQIEHVRMEDVSVSRVTCSPCRVGRTRRTILSAPRPDVLVNLVDRGSGAVRTPEGSSVLAEGEAALCEADSEYHLELRAPITMLTMQLDRRLLPIADTRIHAAHALPLRNRGRVTVLHHFMSGLLAGGALGLDHDDVSYGAIARDLLLLALHEHDDITTAVEEDSAYVVVRSLLERHFTDPDLTIDRIARTLRVSRRYIESVFARHDRSPAAFLRSLRVDRAQAILGSSNVTVAETARLSGFSDTATFSRAFRRATGLPPDSWRRRQGLETAHLTSTTA